ncbi:MAG: DUF2924 domain-containing protein [Deltaproteobacteria bacterium]|nr:DUF2924 domain-containing protein [Deltaproteobacteria bacterium]
MNTAEQIKQVEGLRGAALREKFREVIGLETRSNNRPYLIKRVVHALQARAGGVIEATAAPTAAGATDATLPAARAAKAAPTKKKEATRSAGKRARDPRIPPPGTVLERTYQGKTLRVKVLDEGFEFRGKTYRSLSAVAREASGTVWNGLLFWHLQPYAKRTTNKAA